MCACERVCVCEERSGLAHNLRLNQGLPLQVFSFVVKLIILGQPSSRPLGCSLARFCTACQSIHGVNQLPNRHR